MLFTGVALFVGFIVLTYFLVTYPSPSLVDASSTTNISDITPSAEVVHSSETMKVSTSVGTFVILIPNEAHENWSDEKHKLITDKNSY